MSLRSLLCTPAASFRGLTPPNRCIQLRRHATKARTHHDLKPTKFGQPLVSSHPHLIKEGETTPGISSKEYHRRRKALMDRLPRDSLVVAVAGQMKFMSGQIFYKFRQASDFWYLTGFEEPDAAVILEKTHSPRGYRMTIFSMGKDSHKEKWEGARTSHEDVMKHFEADDAQSISMFPRTLQALSSSFSNIYVDLPSSALRSRKGRGLSHKSLLKYLSPGANTTRLEYDNIVESISYQKVKPLAPEVARLREIKSESEQVIMRQAADISGQAHAKTMRFTRPGLSEHALAAQFEYLCAMGGSQRPAYVPVVASGPNALIIHYTSNNQVIRDEEMILIDAGCEYNGYASDITRTYPASGKFTSAQAALYSAVLNAQKYLVTLCTESVRLSLAQIHRESVESLRKELNKVGFNLQGAVGTGDLEHVLYPHYVGHAVGIDLHESAHFDRNKPLQAGMVVTIEPGIYVPVSPLFPKEFHEIGIRIEDEVLVGKNQPTVLSVNAPKEIVDIEGACQGLLGLEPF